METIAKLESQIRELINSPRKQHLLLKDKAAWNKLCSALDVIGDTELAIEEYVQNANPKSVGEKYLSIYGILQILYVQQDAVESLSEALNIKYSHSPAVNKVRQLRNDSVGHPTNRRKGKSFHFISRITMNKKGFMLMTSYPDGTLKFDNISITKAIESQKESLEEILSNIFQKLRKDEMKHREKFRENKISDIFPPTLGYYFGKVSEAIHSTIYSELGPTHLKLIADIFSEFKRVLTERDILEIYDSQDYNTKLIEYPIRKIEQYFQNIQDSTFSSDDAYIYLYFLEGQFDELKKMATEIDENYASDL